MPKNVMKLLKPSPHRARNDFDLSHRHVFPINFGELLPSTCIEVVPGDHIEMHISDLIRAIPMVTSPFLRAKQHTDVWFVPYNDLWHQFNNFITNKTEPVSSAQFAHNFLPYGSLKQLFQVVPSGDTDIIGRDFAKGRNKLLNLLGYGINQPWGAQSRDSLVNLFRLGAYNSIWYNEYRQQYYDDGSYKVESTDTWLDGNPSALFNFDYLQCDDLSSAGAENSLVYAMTQMRYRCWKKDLFTGLLPSTQFGAVSTIDLGSEGGEVSFDVSIDVTSTGTTGNDVQRWSDVNGNPLEGNSQLILKGNSPANWNQLQANNVGLGNPLLKHDHIVSVTGTGTGSGTAEISSVGGFDMLALRKAEAVQIWRENALRAGNHVKDNMLAHYGVESDFNDHRPRFLGSVSSPLSIGDVMTTANSSTGINDTVGDIAGKGISSLDEKVFKFDAKDFGVIMCITSILPEAEYNAEGVSRPNQLLDAEDFFVPEYENLGLEAVSADTFQFWHTRPNKVLGYAPRYWGYKTKLDKCYSSFMTNGLYSPWCSPKYDVSAALSQASPIMPLSCLYVNPKIFDVNFTVSVDNQDQFLCDMYFDVDAVRPMSVVGLPFS